MTLFEVSNAASNRTIVEKSAVLSDDGRFRYELRRTWDDRPPMTWAMLNPSTADAEKDDPTIRRCVGFARREGCGGIVVVNVFALRSQYPSDLWIAPDPEGPENWAHVSAACDEASLIVVGWGVNWPQINDRRLPSATGDRLIATYGGRLMCPGKNFDGSPRHPLCLRKDTPLEVWS